MKDGQVRLDELKNQIKQVAKENNWTYDMVLMELRKRIFSRRKKL